MVPPLDSKIQAVEQVREASDMILRASENWAPRYKKDKDTFKALVRMETRIETNVRRYFRELAKERIDTLVNWPEVAGKVAVRASLLLDDGFDVEEALLFQVIFPDISKVVTIGARAGENLHGVELGINEYTQSVQKAAKDRATKSAAKVTKTTKERIGTAIDKGITEGLDTDSIAKMVNDAVNDSKRAAMIARTESVESYTQGMLVFGEESGAISKTWELSFDPCDVCVAIVAESGGDTIGMDEDFAGDGGDGPPAHPNCRCGLKLNYAGQQDPIMVEGPDGIEREQ